MNNIIVFVLFYVVIFSSLVFCDDETFRTKRVEAKLNIDKLGVLLSVNETTVPEIQQPGIKYWLTINNPNITSVADNAFDNLMISGLAIKGNEKNLELTKESFNGLPILEFLAINSMVSSDKNLFQSVRNITLLNLVIQDNSKIINEQLSILDHLKYLGLFMSNSLIIDIDTFKHMSSSVQHISFFFNKIESIEPQSFASLKNLLTLEFKSNQQGNLKPGVFDGLDNLQNLIINQATNMSKIKKNVFNGLKNLKTLTIEGSKINEIEIEAFSGLKLQELDLVGNRLRIIKTGSFSGLEVKNLYFSYNIITIENDAFKNSKIKNLHLDHTMIKPEDFNKSAWGLADSTNIIQKFTERPVYSK